MSDHRDDPHPPAPVVRRHYDVGHGKPPVSGRFTPGRSGNPNGRPKRPRGATAFDEALNEKVKVHQNGRSHSMTKERLIDTAIINDAAKGDRHARALYVRRQIARGKTLPDQPPIVSTPVVFAAVFPPGRDTDDD